MATSRAFVATLPDMTDDQLDRVVAWASSTCAKHDMIMCKDGILKLLCVRHDLHSTRSIQRLLRTLLLKYGVALPQKMEKWIQLIAEDEFDEWKRPGGKIVTDKEDEIRDIPDEQQETQDAKIEKPEHAVDEADNTDTRVVHIGQETQYAHIEHPDQIHAMEPHKTQNTYKCRFLSLPQNLLRDGGIHFEELHRQYSRKKSCSLK